jgi:phage shock protein C
VSDRLYRSRTDRVLSGVAGGLAELWNLDPSLVRVVWALLVPLTGGLALLAYIVMAIVVPEGPIATPGASPAPDESPAGAPPGGSVPLGPRPRRGSPGMILGAVLILIGAYLLLQEYLPGFDPDRFWPLILVAVGVVLLVAAAGGSRRGGSRP